MAEVFLKLEGIKKSFGGVRALKGVDLEIRKGEVHCLAGENGCGKIGETKKSNYIAVIFWKRRRCLIGKILLFWNVKKTIFCKAFSNVLCYNKAVPKKSNVFLGLII